MTDWELVKAITLNWRIEHEILAAKFVQFSVEHQIKLREAIKSGNKEDAAKLDYLTKETCCVAEFILDMEKHIPRIEDVEKQMKELTNE